MYQLRFRLVKHLKMTVWISILWKIIMYSWQKDMVLKLLLISCFFWELHTASSYIWVHNFRANQDLDPLSTSKWPPEPQFCKRWIYICPKMARIGRPKVIFKGTFVSNMSLFESFLELCVLIEGNAQNQALEFFKNVNASVSCILSKLV